MFLSGRGHLLSVKDKLCPFPALENALRWSQPPCSTPCEMIIASKFSEQQRGKQFELNAGSSVGKDDAGESS